MSEKQKKGLNDEIDLLLLVSNVWKKRLIVILITVICMIFGVGVALLTPSTYIATSVFITQTSSGEKASSSLGGLASLAGINLNNPGNGSDILPALYPKLVSSVPYQMEVLSAEIIWNNERVSFKDYLLQKKEGTLKKLKKYTIGLPKLIVGAVRTKNSVSEPAEEGHKGLPYKLTEEDFLLTLAVKDIISLKLNEIDGYITLSVLDNDPQVAAQIALAAEQILQKRIIEYKIENTKTLYEFTKQQWLSKQQELYNLQDSLARFNDRNLNISTAYFENKRLRLETQHNMLNTVYNELASQKEQVALQLERDTPIFSVIDPVRIPNVRDKPKRSLILITWTFLGLAISIGFILVREPITRIRRELTDRIKS